MIKNLLLLGSLIGACEAELRSGLYRQIEGHRSTKARERINR